MVPTARSLTAGLVSIFGVMVTRVSAQAPSTDVFLGALTLRGAEVRVSGWRNLTSRPGYDNQPSFSSDGRFLYFTSVREDAQADIYRHDLARGESTRITTTNPESEYSAADIPGEAAVAVIRVERDSTQRLWRIPLDGSAQSVVFPLLKPVGYHAWATPSQVVMFVLGSPNALVVGDRTRQAFDTVVVNVGRSLHRIPGTERVSFVSRAYAEVGWVMELDLASRAMRPLARLPEGVEDYAWLPDGRLIAGSGSRILVCAPAEDANWKVVADLAGEGIGTISRLAVARTGDRIAIVAVPGSSR